ncbi:MAG: ABC-F family ATP-binding cassette domain-containing protein [Synergistaceae bacterium]|jgi:ATP-binding cassette subfamily F protein 3|nr:ABC-F family ATP-binding cassette domain-containing protein [Synergistaceae bacterium]
MAFGEKVIVKNLNWLIAENSRVGLVGDNGTGKTTLLRILAGRIAPDDGSVETAPRVAVGYLPQDLVELGDGVAINYLRDSVGLSSLQERLFEAEARISALPGGSRELSRRMAEHEEIERDFAHMGGYEFDSAARRVMKGLGFADGDETRPCREFSGGWRMRLALAAILLRKPGILLLDEPTNHLDTESMEWLEGWLRGHRGVMIFVSHDRLFIGHMATEIAEMSRGEITRYPMGYERYLTEREAERRRLARAIEDQRERVEHMRRFIDRFRYKSSKAAQVQSRVRQLEKMEIREMDAPNRTVSIKFPEAPRSGYDVIEARSLAKSYGGVEVFSGLDLEIHRGERVALVGVNGAGKSTLLRLLSGTEAPDRGLVKTGHNVRMAYFSQESAQNLDYSHTVWEEACRTGSPMSEADKRGLLGAFLFSGDDIKKPIRILSGGEKSRVALFKLLLSDSNFLILDEPTNHLDMCTRDIFQRALLQYGGTLLIVSHDRFFLDNLAERVLEIRGGALRNYLGNYSRFIERRGEPQRASEHTMTPDPPVSAVRDKRRQEARERNRLYRERRVFIDRIEPLEAEIAALEARRGEIDESLCRPDLLADSALVRPLMIERKSVEESLAKAYAAWEALSESMERIK